MKKIYLDIGIGEADITPPAGITGRFGIEHTLDTKHPIFARALVLKTRNDIIVQITCELIGCTPGTNNRICSKIENELGLDRNKVILTCTHTHSSPWTWDLQAKEVDKVGIETLNWRWLDKVINGCVESVALALKNIKPSILKIGSAKVKDVASNRTDTVGPRPSITKDASVRAEPIGWIDPEVRVLSVHDIKNKLKALFVNYACHPSGYGGSKTEFVSPDFPYHASQFVSANFGRAIPMSYWQGCAGDINVGKFNANGSEEEVQGFGERIADGILKSLESSKEIKVNGDSVVFAARDLELPVGDWIEPVGEARTKFDNISWEVKKYLKKKEPVPDDLVTQWRLAIKRLDVCLLSKSDKMKVRLYLWKLGNLCLMFVPGEWFVRHGQELAKIKPEINVWTTTLTDMDLLYIPDRKAMLCKKEKYGVAPTMRTISNESVDTLIESVQDMINQYG